MNLYTTRCAISSLSKVLYQQTVYSRLKKFLAQQECNTLSQKRPIIPADSRQVAFLMNAQQARLNKYFDCRVHLTPSSFPSPFFPRNLVSNLVQFRQKSLSLFHFLSPSLVHRHHLHRSIKDLIIIALHRFILRRLVVMRVVTNS